MQQINCRGKEKPFMISLERRHKNSISFYDLKSEKNEGEMQCKRNNWANSNMDWHYNYY